MSAKVRCLALTQGDPSGIGPDIALMAWRHRAELGLPFAVFGDAGLLARRARGLGWSIPIVETGPEDAAEVFSQALPVVPTGHRAEGTPGHPSATDAGGTLAAIEGAVAAVYAGTACAVVTNPIAKHVLYAAGFPHPGHTEYLGELARTHWGNSTSPVMLLWSGALAVVPVTVHVPLKQISALLDRELIIETARTVHADMKRFFGIAAPRIACAGLNPHAGEGGNMGREEIEVIAPALEQLREEGLNITGPLSADTMFHPEARASYDVALTMYHDQGLIPIKTLSFDTGVNVTLGLPFVRTSPDHGTAYGLAGSGHARPTSLIAALNLAARLTRAGSNQG